MVKQNSNGEDKLAPRSLGHLLRETLEREGPKLLALIVKSKAEGQTPSSGKPLKEIATLAKAKLTALYQEFRNAETGKSGPTQLLGQPPTMNLSRFTPWLQRTGIRELNLSELRRQAGRGIKLTAISTTFLSGIFLGYGLPATRIKLFPRGTPQDGVTLHSAPYFSLDVTLRWISAILRQTMAHPEATVDDKKWLSSMEAMTQTLLQGIQTGMAAQKDPAQNKMRQAQVDVPLDLESYRLVEIFFRSLS